MSIPPSLLSRWQASALALALAAALVILVRLVVPSLFQGIEERSGEALWRNFPQQGEERRVVIVDIDEDSLARVGTWPWPRETIAELSRRIGGLGASVQVYDIALPEARPGDKQLAAEFARQPVVLAQIFSLTDGVAQSAAGRLRGELAAPSSAVCGSPVPISGGFIANAPQLDVGSVGHISPRIDADGAVRRLPALVCHGGHVYPALGIAALMRAAGLPFSLDLTPGAAPLDPAWLLTHPGLPGMSIPLDEHGDARIAYNLPTRALISVPAIDVLTGRAPAELFKGAWVLVGATAFGIGDAVPTPHGGAVAGVEVHAQFIAAMLDGRLPYSPRVAPWILAAEALVGVLLLLLLAGRRSRLSVWGLPSAAVLAATVLFGLHAYLLLRHHLWLGWMEPAVFVLLTGLLLATFEHMRDRFERERLYRNLTSYLPTPVAAEIAFREPSGAIDASRREITVLFADIRNFSAYCEGRPPEEAAALLHAFFSHAARIIEAHGGLVEEYVGDAVMAIWNAPQPCPDHPVQALAAARQLLAECTPLFPDPPPPGLEPLALGIGIETGEAIVGSFGPVGRRTHTALGETVTIAARLQGMTTDLAYPILLGERAASRVETTALLPLGEYLLEGLRRPRKVFTLQSDAATRSEATVLQLHRSVQQH